MCVCLPIKDVAILTITMDRCVIKAAQGDVYTRGFTRPFIENALALGFGGSFVGGSPLEMLGRGS